MNCRLGQVIDILSRIRLCEFATHCRESRPEKFLNFLKVAYLKLDNLAG
jgi:hypothetical protein